MVTEQLDNDDLPMEILDVVHRPKCFSRSLSRPRTSFIYWNGNEHRVMYMTAGNVRRSMTLDNIRKKADLYTCGETGKRY